MSAAGATVRSYLSIGEVLAQLRSDFPDTTISKLRFLESEGLVEPERTSAGYRKYSHEDVARLRYILSAQRDHYLPLRVIRENLEAIDRGFAPSADNPRLLRPVNSTDATVTVDDFTCEPSDIKLTRTELLEHAGLSSDKLTELEQFGLISCGSQGYYDQDAVTIAQAVLQLGHFGLEPRHLRSFRTGADREIGLFQQVVTPLLRHRSADAKARAQETVKELAALSVRLHSTLVQASLRSLLNT